MIKPNAHIMLVAGEASGDMHAAHLVTELKRLSPGLTFSGLGGPQMKAAGVELYADLTKIAVIGFVEVLRHYGEFRRSFRLFLAQAKERRPDAVVLVDYPGFNLRLARELKKLNIPVIYYISPQVWAWKESRVAAIKRDISRMLVVFQFEKDFYARHNFDVDFVGHPLVDMVQAPAPPAVVLERLGLSGRKPVIGLLPGSRGKEIEKILPVMLAAAAILKTKNPHIHFLLMKAPTIERARLENHLKNCSLPLTVVERDNLDAVQACDVCLVASGTATLETALLERPMVVVYKTSWITWALAKVLVKIDMIALVNIVAGKKIVPELIQFNASPKRLAHEVQTLISDDERRRATREELRKVRVLLGNSGASQRAAKSVLEFLRHKI